MGSGMMIFGVIAYDKFINMSKKLIEKWYSYIQQLVSRLSQLSRDDRLDLCLWQLGNWLPCPVPGLL